MTDFCSQLKRVLHEDSIKEQEPMKAHTTFRIGGPADYFVTPREEEELTAVLQLCRRENMPYYLLGNGSNLLVSDAGYRGLVIAMGEGWNFCEI